MKKHQVIQRLRGMEGKYFDLVWYARCNVAALPDCYAGKSRAAQAANQIQQAMPDECERLQGDHGAWEHGFNSGVLAAVRLVLGLLGSRLEAKYADAGFPELDT